MRALLCDHGMRYEAAYPDPVPPLGEALIRVRLAGICNTDLELVRGYRGFRGVLGHEFVGEVVQAPDASWCGKRVVADINAACGGRECAACGAGRPTHCPTRTTLGIAGRDGAFAEFVVVPQANLYAVPDAVSDEKAVFAEPLAAACEILAQIKLAPTDRVCVLGDGKLGLLVAAVLRLTGADTVLVGHNRSKLAIAEGWGIKTRLADELAPAQAADLVVECTGSPKGFDLARRLLRPRGTLVLKSTYHGTLNVDLSALVVDEITLLGSRCGPFAPALRLLAEGLVAPQTLISDTFPLDQAEAAFSRAVEPGVLKVLLRP